MQLAVFDLDGTITRHDTLVQYVLGFLKSRPRRLFGFVLALPTVLLYLAGRVDRGALKASVIHCTLGGATRQQLDAWTEIFVPSLLDRGVFKDAMERIAGHRRNGDVLILMSASPDIYVPAVARHLGFNDVTCTGVRWNGDTLDGALTTPNCRGAEKALRFEKLRAQYPGRETVAYGNAGSDLDHLQLADRGVLVNGDEAARQAAKAMRSVVSESWS